MVSPIAKVSLDDLQSFLTRHAEEWDVEGLASFEELLPPHRPVTVDELILAIQLDNQGDDYAYLFSLDMLPQEAVEQTNLDAIPSIGEEGISGYVIRMGKARDFLYMAPSFEDMANGFYVNLMPVEEEEQEEPPSPEPQPPFLISAISIENFKGIGERQTIELKPITLLFGPNSGGKSTVLHAIHYAREILVRRNLDADRTETGGDFVDLGGFECFVHKHDRRRRVGLRFELDLTCRLLPEYAMGLEDHLHLGWRPNPVAAWHGPASPITHKMLDFSARVRTACVEFTVAWSDFRQEYFVESYSIDINDVHLAKIRCDYNRREVGIWSLNTKHPIFGPRSFPIEYDDVASGGTATEDCSIRFDLGDELGRHPIFIDGLVDALPRWGSCLSLNLDGPGDGANPSEVADGSEYWERVQFVGCLSQLIVGPGELLRNELARFRYLGPLRETPARGHRPPRSPEPSRWANGLAAWDFLFQQEAEFVEWASDWLSLKDRLDVGYRVELSTFREIPLGSPLAGMLMSLTDLDSIEDLQRKFEKIPISRRLVLIDERAGVEVQPQDVGMGISQLIPVVALALEDRVDLAAIEQPELHIHPRVQTGLGDLFIWAIGSRPAARYLLETHSEHLLLRLIRRIRETGEGELLPGVFPSLTPDRIAVYFVENSGGQTVFKPLRLDQTGEFIDRWPGGFFEERAKELF